MTKEEIFENKQAEITNSDLIDLAEKQIIELARTGGNSHTMCIPPSVYDTDMIFSELVKRFKELESLLEIERDHKKTKEF